MNHQLPLVCQRWREHRSLYRPAGEPIDPSEFDVSPINVTEAKPFVCLHHYSSSFPATRFQFGLFRHGILSGVAIFSMPMSSRVLTNVFPGNPRDSVELGRLVLLDSVKANGESWFFARCRELLRREHIRGIIAFSDDTPRTTIDGRVTLVGHLGTVYCPSNALYLGRSTARIHRLLPNGPILSPRSISKIRNGERGWRYASQILVEAGATPPADNRDLKSWLAQWITIITRPLKHRGNHRYAWSLHRRILPVGAALPYPKTFRTAKDLSRSKERTANERPPQKASQGFD